MNQTLVNQRLLALFLAGALLFNFPLLALWDTMRLRDELETRGVFGAIFCAPATSSKRALVRLTLNAALTEAELEHLEAVAREIAPIVKPWDWPCARRARAQAGALETAEAA